MSMVKVTLILACLAFVNLRPAPKKITIFSIGDSTMSNYGEEYRKKNYGSADYPIRGWMMAMKDFFSDDVTIRNLAVSGRSSKSFRVQGYWDTVMNSIKPGDYVFIQFGHNDANKKDTSRFVVPHTAFKENLLNYVTETKKKKGRPVLFTSIARRRFDSAGHVIDTHGDYVAVVRELAKETNTPLVDLNEKTTALIANLGPEESKKLFLYLSPNVFASAPDGLKDDTHLNEEGATRFAELAAVGIKELGLPLARYLKKL